MANREGDGGGDLKKVMPISISKSDRLRELVLMPMNGDVTEMFRLVNQNDRKKLGIDSDFANHTEMILGCPPRNEEGAAERSVPSGRRRVSQRMHRDRRDFSDVVIGDDDFFDGDAWRIEVWSKEPEETADQRTLHFDARTMESICGTCQNLRELSTCEHSNEIGRPEANFDVLKRLEVISICIGEDTERSLCRNRKLDRKSVV